MSPDTPKVTGLAADRLESWKEIAAYVNREVRTVQRWERERGLPVHRIPGGKKGGVYATRAELDQWLAQKRVDVAISRAEPPIGDVAGELPAAEAKLGGEALGRSPIWPVLGFWALAALCVYFSVVIWHVHLTGPELPGWTAIPERDGAVIIDAVRPGSAAERAGIAPGDRIVSWDGRPIAGFIRLQVIHLKADQSYQLTVERGGTRRVISLRVPHRNPTSWLSRAGMTQLSHLLGGTLCLVLGFAIAYARQRETTARWAAFALVLSGIGVLHQSAFLGIAGAFEAIHQMPKAFGALFLAIDSVSAIAPAAMLMFVCVFPSRLCLPRWVWAALWVPNLVRVGVLLYWWLFLTYSRESFRGFGWTADAGDSAIAPQFLCALGILIWRWRRPRQGDSVRRVRLVLTGLTLTLLSAIPEVTFGVVSLEAVRRLTPIYEASVLPLAVSLLLLAFPIAVAYAIVRRRLFDIRVIVRRGLRYAAARGVLLSLAPLMLLALVTDLWVHRHDQLAETVGRRWALYLAIGAIGGVLHQRQKTWLDVLDRRFFREQYDSRRLLLAVAERTRRAATLEDAASDAASRIDAALHPQFVAILARHPREGVFRAIAATRQVPPPIPADSKLTGILRALGRPLDVSPGRGRWLERHLPQRETDFVRNARLELLVPIALAGEAPEALLALGPKLSEELYSLEDQLLLETVAANLALFCRHARTATEAGESPR